MAPLSGDLEWTALDWARERQTFLKWVENDQHDVEDRVLTSWVKCGISEFSFYGCEDVVPLLESHLKKGGVAYRLSIRVLNLLIEHTPTLWESDAPWQTLLSTFLCRTPLQWTKLKVADKLGFWKNWIRESDPKDWALALSPTPPSGRWKELKTGREMSGLIESIEVDSKEAFGWLFAHLMGRDWKTVEVLQQKGVRYQASFRTELSTAESMYQLLYQTYPVNTQIEATADSRWDTHLQKAWTFLLDIGAPSLTSEGASAKHSLLVAKLELEQEGVHPTQSLKDWFNLSLSHWPYEGDVWAYLKPHGLSIHQLDLAFLVQWMNRKAHQPERITRALSMLVEQHVVFKDPVLVRKEAIERLLPCLFNAYDYQALDQLGLPLPSMLRNGNHPLGHLIMGPKKYRWNHVLALWTYLEKQGQTQEALNFQNNQGQTLMHLALYQGDLHLAKWLMTQGLSPDIQNHVGNTALHELRRFRGNFRKLQAFCLAEELGAFDFAQVNHRGQSILDAIGKVIEHAPPLEKSNLEGLLETLHKRTLAHTLPNAVSNKPSPRL